MSACSATDSRIPRVPPESESLIQCPERPERWKCLSCHVNIRVNRVPWGSQCMSLVLRSVCFGLSLQRGWSVLSLHLGNAHFSASSLVWKGLLAPLTLVFSRRSSSRYLLPPLQASGNPTNESLRSRHWPFSRTSSALSPLSSVPRRPCHL